MRASLLVLILGVGAACIPSETRPQSRQPPRPRSEIAIDIQPLQTLPNGLRVVVLPDPTVHDVRITLRLQVGSVDDPKGRSGMAHMVEHLTFGAPIVGTARTLAGALDAVASSYHGYTSFESTSYIASAPPGRLSELLRIEALRLTNDCDAWTEGAFARQREVIRNEHRERTPIDRVLAVLRAGLYPEQHPYRTFGAELDHLDRITRGEACAFFRAHYAPNRAVLLISGNTSPSAVVAALSATLGQVPAGPIVRRAPIPAAVLRRPDPIHLPYAYPTAVIAWPLPSDPASRARLRMAVEMIEESIEERTTGTVVAVDLGGPSAGILGLVIVPRPEKPLPDAISAVEAAREHLANSASSAVLEAARMHAVYQQFQQLENVARRDNVVLDHVIAGRDPAQTLRDELDALLGLTTEDVRGLLRDRVLLSTATLVKVHPSEARAMDAGGATSAEVATAVGPIAHPPDEQLLDVDPSEAQLPATDDTVSHPLVAARERKLPNGMTVILLPLSSVPTVDARVVFHAGFGDEPFGQRGLARVAASGLRPSLPDRAWLGHFYVAGARDGERVGADLTSFVARGLDRYIDLVLRILAQRVRSGVYPDPWDDHMLRRDAASHGGDLRGLAPWYEARYGTHHPYAREKASPDKASDYLDRLSVSQYRETHFVPSNATLIVAGGFDVAVTERSIDQLFGDWHARPGPARPPAKRAALQPVALAQATGDSLVQIEIALPVAGDRLTALVATEMVSSAVRDVREQLAASYGVTAELEDRALSQSIQIVGAVARDRAAEALTLIRERISGLASDDPDTARRFVIARRKVIAKLRATGSGSRELAEVGEIVLRHGSLRSYTAAAATVRRMTIDQLTPTLRGLDLKQAAILMRGPRDAVLSGFKGAQRVPRFIEVR